ncbi:MAG: hypothetical protein NT062_16160 [Proteobacteria bacterium]|nr:hypothetical protein [Pseudomonadota bacterium]
MYRYGDGTPFPLDENFIEILTDAVETCTNAFLPLAELDERRERARETRKGGEREIGKLADLESAVTATLATYVVPDKKAGGVTLQVAEKLTTAAKQAVAEAKRQVEARVAQLDGAASPKTAADGVLRALAPFFENHQLPQTTWIMSWDARGVEVAADAIATAGKLTSAYSLAVDAHRAPIRVDTLAENIVVHMMKRGMFGKAKPAPIDLGRYAVVAFEHTTGERVITVKEQANKVSPGLRFACTDTGSTWVAITVQGDAEGEPNPLDPEDVAAVRRLVDATDAALAGLTKQRRLVDLTLSGHPLTGLVEPRLVPFELLTQLTPLARSIRAKSRMSGELVLKRDIGDGRREELFVPRATLVAQFARLPAAYRKPFEDMGISQEETQPAMVVSRVPARAVGEGDGDGDTTLGLDDE